MSADKPVPQPTALSQPFWHAAQQGELHIQRCQSCGHWIHFPERACPKCEATTLAYEQVSGLGRIESWSVVHRSFVEGYQQQSPYAIAWIELDEQPGLRLFCNIIDCDLEALSLGQRVTLCFEDRNAFGHIPQFRPINE